jgi:ech hydrogenase subunit A
MDPVITSLFLLPLLTSILVLVLPGYTNRVLVIVSSLALSGISLIAFFTFPEPVSFGVPQGVNRAIAMADLLLLLYFGWVAIKMKSWQTGILTVLQLAAFVYVVLNTNENAYRPFRVDRLTLFMFLLINIISGVISVYSLRYIEGENCSSFRKKYFLSILFWFIGVMNLLVSADNLEYFFLFFELTTLASFLFIGFRRDRESVNNALTALWMNQIGGLAILITIIVLTKNGIAEASFSQILSQDSGSALLLPMALLSAAALIKGAQMPFSKWLLGAMVAPTPVSALLHSSTMVKIAPFMILRLSPVLKNTPVATVIIGLTAFVFVAAAIAALSQDNFKRILAHSTIALLALMMMMAAVGTPVTITAALVLILFHGISKCMLFLNAGILEREFHIRQTSDMDRLGETGPFSAVVITIGFMSLLLPPFGAFIAKWISIESLGNFANDQKFIGALAIVAVAGGGAVLSLLYFKVLGLLIARNGSRDRIPVEQMHAVYAGTTLFLATCLVLGVLSFPVLMIQVFVPVASQAIGLPFDVTTAGWNLHVGTMTLPVIPLLVSFLLLPVTIILAMFIHFRKVDRAKEYTCGEKIDYSFSSFYFSTDKAIPYFSLIGMVFFIALFAVAIL